MISSTSRAVTGALPEPRAEDSLTPGTEEEPRLPSAKSGLSLREAALGFLAYLIIAVAQLTLLRALLPVWLPTGIGLGLQAAATRRQRLKLALAQFATELIVEQALGVQRLKVHLAYALIETAECWLAGALLSRMAAPRLRLGRVREVIALFAAIAISTSLMAVAGAGVQATLLGEQFAPSLAVWFASDSVGMLVLAPAVLLTLSRGWPGLSRREALLASGLGAAIIATAGVLFFSRLEAQSPLVPLAFCIFPPFVASALVFDVPGAALASVVLCLLVGAGLQLDRGPFAANGGSLILRQLLSQFFVGLLSFSALIVGALTTERRVASARLEDALEKLRDSSSRMRQRAEAEARALNEKFKNVFETMQDGYVKAGLDGTIQLVNPAMARLLGYSSGQELIGRNMNDVYADVAERRELVEQLRKEGVINGFRATWKCANGSLVVIEASGRFEHDERGERVAVDALVRDVTTKARQQAELVRAREAAETASEIKSLFLANMSHEIRTPMNAIVGLSQILMQLDLAPRVRDYANNIYSSARALLSLLNDILDFSKIEAGMLVIESHAFELDRMLEDLARSIAVKAEEKRVELMFSVVDEVPPTLIGDPLRLSQVLLNLVSNGIKFTESGGEVVVSIGVAARSGDRITLRCAVRDTGVGLREDQLGQLFKPFVQGDGATTRRHGGTGLGLAISQDLVQRMGGRIEVQSALGQGSTFSFTVELGVGEGSTRAPPFPDLRGLRVLVVDDNKTAREILERSLSSLTFEVRSVASGAEALRELAAAAARGAAIEMVLLDWQMPEMDGFEVARRIRGDPLLAEKPLVFMITAFGRQEMLEKESDLTPDAFLVKPLSRSALVDALMLALRGAHGRARAPEAASRAAWAGTGEGARVLVVEDNEVNRQVVSELLDIAGFRVDTVASGRAALERLQRAPDEFAVVLMDVQMPEMDGYETARAIRNQLKLRLPIVALSAHAFEAERLKSIEAGMNDHVTKPIDAQGLIAVLKRWIKSP